MFEFKLPDLGEGVAEGEILHWHVKQGDAVGEDDPLVEVETDKAAVTIPSPRAGKIVSMHGAVGDTITVGQTLVVIEDGSAASDGEKPRLEVVRPAPEQPAATLAPVPAVPANQPAQLQPANGAEEQPAKNASTPRAAADQVIPAAPATRRLARELGVDLHQVPPSGPAGRVTAEDVRRFAQQGGAPEPAAGGAQSERPASATSTTPAASVEGQDGTMPIPFFKLEPLPEFERWGEVAREPMRSIRRKVARKMVTSMVVAPHVVHMDEADVTDLEVFRRRERERRQGQPGGRVTLLAFAVKAVTAQLKRRPKFNASIDPFSEEIVYKKFFNVGFAADTDKGLVVPVVEHTDRKSILEISAEIEDKATRARDGALEVSELRGGTFTITNVGSLGGTNVIPTINYPEVAILGMGRAQPRPVVLDGEIAIRTMLPLTLAFDHRIIDGADAARFMAALVRSLSDPSVLMMES